jgi:hypothetical protein
LLPQEEEGATPASAPRSVVALIASISSRRSSTLEEGLGREEELLRPCASSSHLYPEEE